MMKATIEIKEIFKEFIKVEPHLQIYGIVSHPIFQHSMVVDPSTMEMIDLFKEKEKAFKVMIDNAMKIKEVEMMLEFIRKPWRLDFVELIMDEVSQKLFSELLIHAYVTTEFPNWTYTQRGEMDLLLDMFQYANQEFLMNCDEYAVFRNLPNEIEIYRGIYGNDVDEDYPAMSWTLDLEQAKWFSTRFNKTSYQSGRVIKAKINLKDTFAYIEREKEIIVNCNKLYDVEEV